MKRQKSCGTRLLKLSLAVLIIYPVAAFAAESNFDPYAASEAQGHYLKTSLGSTPSISAQISSAPYSGAEPVPVPKAQPVFVSEASNDITQASDLESRTGIEAGFQASYYRYQEHVHEHPEFIHEIGPKLGITLTGTQRFDSGLFVSADTRFAYGQNHYHSVGTGTQNGLTDYLGEVRLLGGRDFIFTNVNYGGRLVNFDFSPYLGVGYRNLFNDWSGKTSTGANGYRRDSQYLYLPVGLTQRTGLGGVSRLATNVEYDQLLQGWQTSYLSDFNSPLGDINHRQNSGYGLRGSIMYEKTSWAFGPFLDYWNINKSDLSSGGRYEPHNQTIEYGLQGRYHF